MSPSSDPYTALMRERYGPLRDLERERFTPVPVRTEQRKRLAPPEPITEAQAELNLWQLTLDLERRDRLMRGAAA